MTTDGSLAVQVSRHPRFVRGKPEVERSDVLYSSALRSVVLVRDVEFSR